MKKMHRGFAFSFWRRLPATCRIEDRAVSTSVQSQDDLVSYELGNEIRGFESGEFPDDEIAWLVLSRKFNERFPSAAGRHVELRKVIRWGRVGPRA
ncbi:hypothetical protein KK137_15590 [Croceibacterium sp. LX-88]|uniref:Uncharacterized protein n=1 Tax=Croceibacterium selenioxidans TaxID=2838833 RepID=A0ABS5W7P7_9SPHN|nr:hypothetical protein [Croceibacterium selenioxidans]MBT2135761.1 hypothetical protein [Croceibacterium selenioxidans]